MCSRLAKRGKRNPFIEGILTCRNESLGSFKRKASKYSGKGRKGKTWLKNKEGMFQVQV